MKKVSTLRAGLEISFREEFENNSGSFWGAWFSYVPGYVRGTDLEAVVDMDADEVFVVGSYDKALAVYNPLTGWVVSGRKYSATTSRHTGVIRRALGL